MGMKSEMISVITIVKNDRENIIKTMLSVLEQTYDRLEYIIKDGMSDDGTSELIEKVKSDFSKKEIIYINKNDKGIFDAMNQAVTYCNGEWIIFINSGDEFYNKNVLNDVFYDKCYKDNEVLYGDAVVRDEAGDAIWKADISLIRKKMPFCHQSCFIKRNILLNNPFDTKYKIAADYNNILELYMQQVNFLNLRMIISIFDLNGVSSVKFVERSKERNQVIRNNGCKGKKIIAFLIELFFEYVKEKMMKVIPTVMLSKFKRWYKHHIKRYEKI